MQTQIFFRFSAAVLKARSQLLDFFLRGNTFFDGQGLLRSNKSSPAQLASFNQLIKRIRMNAGMGCRRFVSWLLCRV